MNSSPETKARAAVIEAADYLRCCGIRLPQYRITTEPPDGRIPFGGSFVDGFGGTLRLNMGRYPTRFLRNWFAMHELGHLIWHLHRPLHWKRFRQEFGEPTPVNYDAMATAEAWKTAATGPASWFAGRADGDPPHQHAQAAA